MMIFLIVLAALICSSACQYDCTAPNGEMGSCVLFPQCPHLVEQWNSASRSELFAVSQLLRSLNCGYRGVTPQVCCVPQSVQRPPVVPSDGNNRLPDLTRHRNIGMLSKRCGEIENDKILNGNRTGVFEFPWMALLAYRINGSVSFQCGGSVINRRYILTAAHCVTNLGNATLAGVRVGEHDLRTDPDCEGPSDDRQCRAAYQDIPMERAIFHPEYNGQTYYNDIALIRLARPIVRIDPICLPTSGDLRNAETENNFMVVAGWGLTENNSPSEELLKIQIPVINNTRCGEILNRSLVAGIARTQLCAGGLTRTDACRGDSGGPLKFVQEVEGVQRYVQHGIVSFGARVCGTAGIPAVYTRLTYFMDWLLDQLQP